MNYLTQKELKKFVDYDPKTGIFRWVIANSNRVKVGDMAGYIHRTKGYRYICINEKRYKASRLAFLYMEGYFPEHQVDHKNRIRDNDSWNNLRHVSSRCNSRNCKISKANKSGVIGVCWDKQSNKWSVKIGVLNKSKHIGYYKYFFDAVKARWEAEKKYGWPNCNTASSAFNYLQEVVNGKIDEVIS